jgi:hypothetical protein
MLFKARSESVLLMILRTLNTRMVLAIEEQKYYLNLKKGFEGEVKFDLLTETLQSDCLILNDLLLEINHTTFQIDTLIIFQDRVYLFEVKNFEGDYSYDADNFKTNFGNKYQNPLDQLKRSKNMLHQLLQKYEYTTSIDASVIFINQDFTLYHAPLELPFIFPSQINRILKKLNIMPSRLSNLHKNLAEKLVSLHQSEAPANNRLPPYEYEQLRKGITCKECSSFSMTVHRKKVACNDCGCEEVLALAVIRCVKEFKLLFPNRKITTNEIYEWCKVIESKKRISRILESNFKKIGVRKWTFFE